MVADMRLMAARCQFDYTGRLSAHFPMATRLIIWKADWTAAHIQA
jgi:RecB family endonuclease NucS